MLNTITPLQQIREEMPATTRCLYFNTGTFGPLPRCSAQAIQERIWKELYEGRQAPKFLGREEIYGQARHLIAQLLHADDEEIALTDSTSEGLNIVCYGFDWRAGDEVITTDHEHTSAFAPLFQIRKRFGVTVRCAELGIQGERSASAAIAALITPRTRLIVISHVSFKTGSLFDIRAVATQARRHGIAVLVDGAQSAGVMPLNMQELDVDFYTVPMQKWLCGPDGTGALYARRGTHETVQATYARYLSMKDMQEEWTYPQSARRFEWGGRQTAALAGQVASLRWLEESVGYPWIYQRISELHTYAFQTLKALPGVTILTPRPGDSGLLTFCLSGVEVDTAIERLRGEHNIHLRSIKDRQALRISTGFYNTEAEIDTLARTLRLM